VGTIKSMRSLIVALGLLALAPQAAEAKRSKPKAAAKAKRTVSRTKSVAAASDVSTRKPSQRDNKRGGGKADKRDKTKAKLAKRPRRYVMPRGPIDGQSLGAPWAGALHDAELLEPGEGYYIRRPWRAFGTSTMVDILERVVTDVADRFYDTHAIAIGDLSAETGGRITDHSSHQSGRDVDIGLIFKQRPLNYPDSFVVGTSDNLDLEATFVLVEELAKTASEAGGLQVMFLDFKVQGLLYVWALENGENPEYLAKLFQYPHGRGQCAGLVRHEPNHADHIHARFTCPPGDGHCAY
jgi:murein endopeptidase